MLRTRLFKGFAVVIILFCVLSLAVGIRTIQKRVMDEAQTRVRLDLSSAWAVCDSKQSTITTVLELVAGKESVVEACARQEWTDEGFRAALDAIRLNQGLDFLDLISPEGQVVLRTTPPYAVGDHRLSDPTVTQALQGKAMACMSSFSSQELKQEAVDLPDRAFIEIEKTPRARRSLEKEETRGMVMVCAAPVRKGGAIIGLVYGGILVNRNYEFVDRIHDVIYKNEEYKGAPKGTATIFLHDTRIATTVREANGNRALGTRASKEVADAVLDNGRSWFGDAFVVNDWYLTAYDPIRDGGGKIIGMLYVGILKQPFLDYQKDIVVKFLLMTVFVVVVSLFVAFLMALRLARPIHKLVEASNAMRQGHRPSAVVADRAACTETAALTSAFNLMSHELTEREDRLKALNRSYVDMLGFVSHELKSPVASMTNYVYLLQEGTLGPLTEKQEKAVDCFDRGCRRLIEMVRHYLNLSRIENGELSPNREQVVVWDDVLDPLVASIQASLQAKGMQVDIQVPRDIAIDADSNMAHEVFENLLSNAIKYGRDGGNICISSKADGAFVAFSVRNDGEGIPEGKLGDLFKKFSRLSNGDKSSRVKGTGLGLFITKQIVEAHGGRIGVSSQEGEWAEFTFTLPRYKDEGKV